jgi:serine protease Do
VDLNGTAVGIATALASEDGGFQGIGFAIPARLVKKLVADSMESHRKETAPPGPRK